MLKPIYLDANATSRVRPEVGAVFAQLYGTASVSGNPSSVHHQGRAARAALRRARHQLLEALGFSDPNSASLVFTSGGTESCQTMLRSLVGSTVDCVRYPQHVVSSSIEHPAVIESVKSFERMGWGVTWVSPNADGRVSVDAMLAAIRPETALVTLMQANNETGVIQPLVEVARELREAQFQGVFVSDCIQAFGKMQFDAPALFSAGVDAIALSGHKIGATPGIGAVVYAKHSDRCSRIDPLLVGGPQETGLRGGTENLLGACAFAAVSRSVMESLTQTLIDRSRLRTLLWQRLNELAAPVESITPGLSHLGLNHLGLDLMGAAETSPTLCNTALLRFPGCRGDDLVVALDLQGVSASIGSACASGKQGVSHVIRAMGLSDSVGKEVLRISLDWDTSAEDIEAAAERIALAVSQMRAASREAAL